MDDFPGPYALLRTLAAVGTNHIVWLAASLKVARRDGKAWGVFFSLLWEWETKGSSTDLMG